MHDGKGIAWVRVIVAGVLTEASIVFVIAAAVTVYRHALSATPAETGVFSARVGYYVGVFGGMPAAIAFALWVGRSVRASFILNGALVGCVAALVHLSLFAASGMGFQVAYVIADALKVAGGAMGGFLAQRRAARRVG